jgi:hypothetical protein
MGLTLFAPGTSRSSAPQAGRTRLHQRIRVHFSLCTLHSESSSINHHSACHWCSADCHVAGLRLTATPWLLAMTFLLRDTREVSGPFHFSICILLFESSFCNLHCPLPFVLAKKQVLRPAGLRTKNTSRRLATAWVFFVYSLAFIAAYSDSP